MTVLALPPTPDQCPGIRRTTRPVAASRRSRARAAPDFFTASRLTDVGNGYSGVSRLVSTDSVARRSGSAPRAMAWHAPDRQRAVAAFCVTGALAFMRFATSTPRSSAAERPARRNGSASVNHPESVGPASTRPGMVRRHGFSGSWNKGLTAGVYPYAGLSCTTP